MQALIELLAGFIALLVAAALGQFGVEFEAPAKPQREMHRVSDCREAAPEAMIAVKRNNEC